MRGRKQGLFKENTRIMANTLYVGNLPYGTTDDQLKSLFSQAGAVASASVIADKFTGRSKGFGFVEMGSEAEAQKAVEQLNGYELEGRALKVSEARPREERPARFGGGNGGGGRRFGGGRQSQYNDDRP